ncbi:M15 family metallopeptidase [Acinetobacter guerrae]|uniref:M15 family metallopeptidase n=1 Tax=Acinetobacter guerrae TaxID=1843371 RepID=UPI00125EB757|nr:M15 family metallopeptidase [Acinetobacter guerrae]
MILLICFCFVGLVITLACLMSFEFRHRLSRLLHSVLPQSKQKFNKVKSVAKQIHHASAPEQLQLYWHVQQWWILIAGFFLFASIMVFAFTRQISPTHIEADYLKEVDPQIYTLLNGEILIPPPEVDESLVEAAIIEANQLEQQYQTQSNHSIQASQLESIHVHRSLDPTLVDRKWDKMHARYKQRLLMVFKLMKERYGYELVLLEGYRSPARQNILSNNPYTTRARGYQSYHQFGLAADVAFKRNGKVVITERDPWAMRGYQLYGEVSESVGLTWGGRWKSIQDYGHTEYRMPGLKKTKEMADKMLAEAERTANN